MVTTLAGLVHGLPQCNNTSAEIPGEDVNKSAGDEEDQQQNCQVYSGDFIDVWVSVIIKGCRVEYVIGVSGGHG